MNIFTRLTGAAFVVAAVLTFTTCGDFALKQTIADMVERKVDLLGPDNEAQIAEKTPELTWSSIGDAVIYEVQLSVTEDFADPVTGTSTEMLYEVPDPLTIGDYRYWRVRAVGSDGTEGDWSEIRNFEIVPSATPKVVASFNIRNEYPNANPFSVALSGNYAYIPLGSAGDGLAVLDFSTPSAPKLVGSFKPSSGRAIYHAAIYGNHLYCHEAAAGALLHVLDISDPAKPKLAGSSTVSVLSDGMVATVGGVTIAVNGTTVQYYDTDNLSNISDSNTETIPDNGWIPETAGNNCYVIVENTGLYIYGTYDRGLKGTYSIPGIQRYYAGLSGYSDYVYVAKDDLLIIDCSKPAAPQLAETYSLDDYNFYGGLDISGHYLIGNTKEEKIVVIDIREPTAPAFVGAVEASAGWPETNGNYVVGPVYASGILEIMDLVPEG